MSFFYIFLLLLRVVLVLVNREKQRRRRRRQIRRILFLHLAQDDDGRLWRKKPLLCVVDVDVFSVYDDDGKIEAATKEDKRTDDERDESKSSSSVFQKRKGALLFVRRALARKTERERTVQVHGADGERGPRV